MSGPNDPPPDEPNLPRDDGHEPDMFAAEFALGVLDREERAAAEARSRHDPAFAQEIVDWVIRLFDLIDLIEPVEPTADLWLRIEKAVDDPEEVSPPAPEAANDERPLSAPAKGLALWRAWALAATAVAAAALFVIALHPSALFSLTGASSAAGAASGKTLVATLDLKDGGASAMTIAYDSGAASLYASPDADFSIPRARAAELWLIPADGKPRPLGVVDPSKPSTMTMPKPLRALVQDKAALALSIEPPGGSPTGLPTGPVVADGKLGSV